MRFKNVFIYLIISHKTIQDKHQSKAWSLVPVTMNKL